MTAAAAKSWQQGPKAPSPRARAVAPHLGVVSSVADGGSVFLALTLAVSQYCSQLGLIWAVGCLYVMLPLKLLSTPAMFLAFRIPLAAINKM